MKQSRFQALRFRMCCALSIAFSSLQVYAANCKIEQAVPAGQQQIATGSAIVSSDGVSTVQGDQAVYLQVKNANVLGVSYDVTIARDTSPADVICTYSAILPPQTTVIFSGAVFASPPIGWKITVAIGDASDAGVLTYSIFSLKSSARAKGYFPDKFREIPVNASRKERPLVSLREQMRD